MNASLQPVSAEASAVAETIDNSLRSARELLGMEIAWVAEFREGKQIFRALDGDQESFGFSEGLEVPLDGSYCQRVVLGRIPNLVPDASAEPELRDLEATSSARIGSYIGVPIQLVDGTVYGTLCAASHRPNGDLSEQDVDFLRGISRRVAAEIEELRLA